jgi:hypothetical protein
MIITWMNKTKNPVKFPLAQPVRDEYAEFLISIYDRKVQISLRMGSLEILIYVMREYWLSAGDQNPESCNGLNQFCFVAPPKESPPIPFEGRLA